MSEREKQLIEWEKNYILEELEKEEMDKNSKWVGKIGRKVEL